MKRILNKKTMHISLKSKFYMEIILQPHTQAPNMKNIIVIFSLFFILSGCSEAQAQDNNKKDTKTSKSAPLSAPVGQHAAMMMDNSYNKMG